MAEQTDDAYYVERIRRGVDFELEDLHSLPADGQRARPPLGHRDAPVPEGLVRLRLPGAIYARFAHRGPAREVDQTVSYAYSTWLMAGEYRHTCGLDLEIYGEGFDPESDDSELFYAIPIRR